MAGKGASETQFVSVVWIKTQDGGGGGQKSLPTSKADEQS